MPPGSVGYRKDAMRFMGATFDASGLYRFNAVRRMLWDNGLTTARISAHVGAPAGAFAGCAGRHCAGRRRAAQPLPGDARFLAFRSPDAQRWSSELKERNCITDVRGDVLRIGLALYHDETDIEALRAPRGGPALGLQSAAEQAVGDSGDVLGHFLAPNPEAKPQEDVHAHDRPGLDLGREPRVRGDHFALLLARLKPSTDAFGGRHVMLPEAFGIDELGFVDDPIDFAVRRATKSRNDSSARSLAVERSVAPASTGATWSRTCADMSRTSSWNTASLLSK